MSFLVLIFFLYNFVIGLGLRLKKGCQNAGSPPFFIKGIIRLYSFHYSSLSDVRAKPDQFGSPLFWNFFFFWPEVTFTIIDEMPDWKTGKQQREPVGILLDQTQETGKPKKSQKWQLHYFFEVDDSTDLEIAKRLYCTT